MFKEKKKSEVVVVVVVVVVPGEGRKHTVLRYVATGLLPLKCFFCVVLFQVKCCN